MNTALSKILEAVGNHRQGDATGGITVEEALELSRTYPFFIIPAVMALRDGRNDCDTGKRKMLLKEIAFNAPDPQRAFLKADVSTEEMISFYPTVSKEVNTFDAISKFLDTYGHSDPRETALLERMIFNPTPDYASVLAREEENAPACKSGSGDNPQDALIDRFLLEHMDDESSLLPRADSTAADTAEGTAPHTVPSKAAAPIFDTSLSESLAKIYIKQKRYDKAYEIIHSLSLNNPKKSVYFADQMRFLRKLMLNRGMKPTAE